MRVAAALGLATVALLLSAATALAGPLEEPVSLAVTAPATAGVGETFTVAVAVQADPGALDIAAQPLRLRVRLAPECGGSFAGSEGPTAIDRTLPAPTPGARYSAEASGRVRIGGAAGTETVCAFLEDAQERQFATETEATVTIGPGCVVVTRKLAQLRRGLKKQRQRVRHWRRRYHHAQGKRRREVGRRLRTARRRQRRLTRRLRRARRATAVACAGG